ncbi:hypothetical protein [Ascidiimonas aurantiaca]|uniref:hypothetical protein n=1 Tax=Ascidiimonas aurantiaca TaxID=1685432 RepID=UPI0030EB706B
MRKKQLKILSFQKVKVSTLLYATGGQSDTYTNTLWLQSCDGLCNDTRDCPTDFGNTCQPDSCGPSAYIVCEQL